MGRAHPPRPLTPVLVAGVGCLALLGWIVVRSTLAAWTLSAYGPLFLVLALVGVRRGRLRPRGPWLAFLVAQPLVLVALAVRLAAPPATTPLTRLLADPDLWSYLATLPMLAFAGRLPRTAPDRVDVLALVDALVLTVGVALPAWAFIGAPGLAEGTLVRRLLDCGYIAADGAMVALSLQALSRGRSRNVALWLVITAFGVLLTWDAWIAAGRFGLLPPLDDTMSTAMGAAAWVIFLTAVQCPSATHMFVEEEVPAGRMAGGQRVTFVAAVLTPALLPFADVHGPVDRWIRCGLMLALLAAVSARLLSSLSRLTARELQVRRAAAQDPVSGLLTRAGFLEEFARSTIPPSRRAVMFLDLDHFKAVNDTFGHRAGDDLLRHVGDLLARRVMPAERAARLGGDEFLLLLDRTDAELADLGARIVAELRRPIDLPGHGRVRIGVSVGASRVTGADRLSEAMHRADAAMYAVKRDGRAGFRLGTASAGPQVGEATATVPGQREPASTAGAGHPDRAARGQPTR